MYHKYLIIQTDTEDYYVECPNEKFYERLCSCVPHTLEFRGWHGSTEKEGRELGHKGSVEIFGRDIIAIAEGTEKAPWNPERFKEQLKKSIGDEYVYSGTANVVVTTNKSLQPFELTLENSIILGMSNLMFFANGYQHPIPWLRATDHDVAEVIKSAKRWLSARMPNTDTQDKPVETSARPEKPRIVGLLTYTPESKTLHATPMEITLEDITANLLKNPPKCRYVTQGATPEETCKILRQVIPTLEPDEMLVVDYANFVKPPVKPEQSNN